MEARQQLAIKGPIGNRREQFDDVFTGIICETFCPVVRIHPETGERLLVIGDSVRNFVGLEEYVSRKLFEHLQSYLTLPYLTLPYLTLPYLTLPYLTSPENTVRWSWRSGDVVIWHNRATQRYAIKEASDRDRVERRTAIGGDVPLSIAGPRSVARTKSKPQAAKAA